MSNIFFPYSVLLFFPQYERTETIQDNLNPEFAKKLIIDYFFEEAQRLKFEVYVACHIIVKSFQILKTKCHVVVFFCFYQKEMRNNNKDIKQMEVNFIH